MHINQFSMEIGSSGTIFEFEFWNGRWDWSTWSFNLFVRARNLLKNCTIHWYFHSPYISQLAHREVKLKGDATTSTIVQESTIFTINVQLSTIVVTVFLIVTIIVDNCTLIVKMVDSCTIVLVVASPLVKLYKNPLQKNCTIHS